MTDEVCAVGLCRTHRWTPAMARRRATRGARLLDQLAPGWTQEIDREQLHMHDSSYCVLGQAGDYLVETLAPRTWEVLRWEAEQDPGYQPGEPLVDYDIALPYVFRERFGLNHQAAEHGFTLPDCIGTCQIPTAWEMLDCAWLEQILARRDAHRVAVAEVEKILEEVRA